MKFLFEIIVGIVSSIGIFLYGGWSEINATLLFFIVFDYLTGLTLAGFFQNSSKTKSGGLSSKICIQGIFKKIYILILVAVAYRVDHILNMNFIMANAVSVIFITNEALSIIENCSLMGIPIPKRLRDALDLLNKKDEN